MQYHNEETKMKKNQCSALALGLIGAVLAGCGGSAGSQDSLNAAQKRLRECLNFCVQGTRRLFHGAGRRSLCRARASGAVVKSDSF